MPFRQLLATRGSSAALGRGKRRLEPHAELGNDIFQIFRQQQPRRRRRSTSGRCALFGDHRKGDQGDVGKLARELRHGARHVVVRRDDDQRTNAGGVAPSAGSRSRCRPCSRRNGRDRRSTPSATDRPGSRRAISADVVARCTPVIRRRLPRPSDRSSIASTMRDDPPVRTTMPSALRSSATSSVGTDQTNHQKPAATAMPPQQRRAAIAPSTTRRAATPDEPRGGVARPAFGLRRSMME